MINNRSREKKDKIRWLGGSKEENIKRENEGKDRGNKIMDGQT